MTAAACGSPNHVSSLARWIAKAREENPGLDDGQAAERAGQLKAEFFGWLSAAGIAARAARRRPPRQALCT
jgi:hypothetical protein